MRREVDVPDARWILEPGCAEPCLLLLSINRTRYTYELIRKFPEIVVNVPGGEAP